jgi:hypothetical protein
VLRNSFIEEVAHHSLLTCTNVGDKEEPAWAGYGLGEGGMNCMWRLTVILLVGIGLVNRNRWR